MAFTVLQMVLLHRHSGESYHSEGKSRLFQDFSSAVVYFLRLAGNLLYSPGGLRLTAIVFAQSLESRCYKCEPPHLAHVQTEHYDRIPFPQEWFSLPIKSSFVC